MVYFDHTQKSKENIMVVDYLFYFACIILAVSVLSYLVFNFKVQLQQKQIQTAENMSIALGTVDNRAYSKKFLNYKKQIDDFTAIISDHKITSNVFNFIEKNTLPDIWFSSFNMQESSGELKLSGEVSDLGQLSQQIAVFEKSTNYVSTVSVVDSQENNNGRVSFALDLVLKPEIFNYQTANNLLPVQSFNSNN